MDRFRLLVARRRSLAWLLWLALLLPLVQAANFGHALSHIGSAAESDGGHATLHRLHCDLCLTGEALAHGAPPVTPLAIAPALAVQSPPAAPLVHGHDASTALAYRSRAPPISPV